MEVRSRKGDALRRKSDRASRASVRRRRRNLRSKRRDDLAPVCHDASPAVWMHRAGADKYTDRGRPQSAAREGVAPVVCCHERRLLPVSGSVSGSDPCSLWELGDTGVFSAHGLASCAPQGAAQHPLLGTARGEATQEPGWLQEGDASRSTCVLLAATVDTAAGAQGGTRCRGWRGRAQAALSCQRHCSRRGGRRHGSRSRRGQGRRSRHGAELSSTRARGGFHGASRRCRACAPGERKQRQAPPQTADLQPRRPRHSGTYVTAAAAAAAGCRC